MLRIDKKYKERAIAATHRDLIDVLGQLDKCIGEDVTRIPDNEKQKLGREPLKNAINRIEKLIISGEIPHDLVDDALWDRILANATDEEKKSYKLGNRPTLHCSSAKSLFFRLKHTSPPEAEPLIVKTTISHPSLPKVLNASSKLLPIFFHL